MERLQHAADSAENIMISLYRAQHATALAACVSVECGMCGAVQLVRPRRGARWVAMECRRCGLRSLAPLPHEMREEPASGLDPDWSEGLD